MLILRRLGHLCLRITAARPPAAFVRRKAALCRRALLMKTRARTSANCMLCAITWRNTGDPSCRKPRLGSACTRIIICHSACLPGT